MRERSRKETGTASQLLLFFSLAYSLAQSEGKRNFEQLAQPRKYDTPICKDLFIPIEGRKKMSVQNVFEAYRHLVMRSHASWWSWRTHWPRHWHASWAGRASPLPWRELRHLLLEMLHPALQLADLKEISMHLIIAR